uniref:Sarcoglycan, alpha n=1 Tax=Neogobius melanostomus TaxID=47308 RepID=A0A8C6SCJ8_9GOBI
MIMHALFICFPVCAVTVLRANAEIKFTVPVGKLFTYELLRETFQGDFEPISRLYAGGYDDPIIFKCNLQNFPDLPEWLRFTQRHPYDNGFLYGTPMVPGKSIIEVWGVNKRSYQTKREILVIKIVDVRENTFILPYQAEFFLKLREIEKVLPPAVQSEIKADLQRLWTTEALEIVNITNALDRGGRVPLPLAGHFEGVYVKVGSERYFSNCLLKALSPDYSRQCSQGISSRIKMPSVPSRQTAYHRLICSLCPVRSVLPDARPARPTMGSGIIAEGGDFDPPESPPSRDFFPDYIVTVIVPLIIAILLCVLLLYIMFCRREGLNSVTPHLKLYHHHTILDNTDELRDMAGNRSVTPPLSTLPCSTTGQGKEQPHFLRLCFTQTLKGHSL